MPGGRRRFTARKSTGGRAPRRQLATKAARKSAPPPTIDPFIPVKLHHIVEPQFITRRQKYTEETIKIYKAKTKLHRDSLIDEIKKNTVIGKKIKKEMNNRNNQDMNKWSIEKLKKYLNKNAITFQMGKSKVYYCRLAMMHTIVEERKNNNEISSTGDVSSNELENQNEIIEQSDDTDDDMDILLNMNHVTKDGNGGIENANEIQEEKDMVLDEPVITPNTIDKTTNMIPNNHLMSINKDWDCDDRKVCDDIRSLLTRDWNSWCISQHDVSNKSFVIGKIIDPENPAVKYGLKKDNHYGLFAVKPIKKYTLLFEYTGCVKPVGEAATENQFDHFNLIGHLDDDRDKNIWGANPDDELVVDPSRFHNEGLYINDYRHNVMIDDETASFAARRYDRTQNVQFYEVLVDGFPHIFAVSCGDISVGEELLTDYGNKYWDNYVSIIKPKTSIIYPAISHTKHILFVFGYLRTEIEQKYNFFLPPEIKYFCSKWAELFLDTLILKYNMNEINNFIDALSSKLTVIKHALPLKDESFKLLYRSSRDGFSASKFHELCDDKGQTVTIIYNSYGYVFGGYTSVSWKCLDESTSWGFKSDETAFLYNIRNKRRDIDDGIVTIYPIKTSTAHRYAICCGSNYLPTFGNGSDIDVRENGATFCCCNMTYNIGDYSRFCGEKHWKIKEIEVFAWSVDGELEEKTNEM